MILFVLIFVFIDICSKIIVDKYLILEENVKLVNNFIYITYVRNTGAAWSVLSSRTYLVLIISFLIIVGIVLFLYKNKPNSKLEKFAYSMILGGAFGNFLNRLVYGYVIDFIDIRIFNYDYPIFNFADVFIVLGVLLLIIYTWRYGNGNSGKRKQSSKAR